MEKTKEKITYKTRPIRLSDKTWDKLKRKKIMSGESWNLFLSKILEKKTA